MNKMFLDIETLPVEKEKHDLLLALYERKKEKHSREQRTYAEFLAGTGLDGAFGRICCISYAINDAKPISFFGEERKILEDFWNIAKEADLFVGFNLMAFDLRFIYQRSAINGVKPSLDLSFARYKNFPIYDVMWEWKKWDTRSSIDLHTLAVALGIPSSKGGTIEGKDVAKAFEDGRIKEIVEYCEKDVIVTREIYKKLTFST